MDMTFAEWCESFAMQVDPALRHAKTLHHLLFEEWMSQFRAPEATQVSPDVAHVNRLAWAGYAERDGNINPTVTGASWVYVFESLRGDYIKIGTSSLLLKRFKTLQRHLPFDIRIALLVDGGRPLEKALHRVFAGQRTKGEWFFVADLPPHATGKSRVYMIERYLCGMPVIDKADPCSVMQRAMRELRPFHEKAAIQTASKPEGGAS